MSARGDFFIDETVMPGEWDASQRAAWAAWAWARLADLGGWVPLVADRTSGEGERGPAGERHALLGFTENGENRGYWPPRTEAES